jgi:hypothetical protein
VHISISNENAIHGQNADDKVAQENSGEESQDNSPSGENEEESAEEEPPQRSNNEEEPNEGPLPNDNNAPLVEDPPNNAPLENPPPDNNPSNDVVPPNNDPPPQEDPPSPSIPEFPMLGDAIPGQYYPYAVSSDFQYLHMNIFGRGWGPYQSPSTFQLQNDGKEGQFPIGTWISVYDDGEYLEITNEHFIRYSPHFDTMCYTYTFDDVAFTITRVPEEPPPPELPSNNPPEDPLDNDPTASGNPLEEDPIPVPSTMVLDIGLSENDTLLSLNVFGRYDGDLFDLVQDGSEGTFPIGKWQSRRNESEYIVFDDTHMIRYSSGFGKPSIFSYDIDGDVMTLVYVGRVQPS